MIPILILAGIVVGRWWIVPVVALLWPLVLLVTDADGTMLTLLVGGAVAGSINAALGVGLRKGLQWALRHRQEVIEVTSPDPSTRGPRRWT